MSFASSCIFVVGLLGIASSTISAQEVCNSTECRATAKLLLALIDKSRNPCDDFYKFACGNNVHEDEETSRIQASVAKYMQARVDSIRQSAVVELVNRHEKRHGNHHGEAWKHDDMPEAMHSLANYYTQCKRHNESTYEEDEQRVFDHLRGFAKWPLVVTQWTPQELDIADVAGRIKGDHDVNFLVGLEPRVDIHNSSRTTLLLQAATLNFHAKDYNATFREKRKRSISRTIQQLVLADVVKRMRTKEINKIADEIVSFEATFARLVSAVETIEEVNVGNTKLYTLDALSELFNGSAFLKKFIHASFHKNDTLGHAWLDTNSILVRHTDYFRELATLISNSDKRIVANYLFWRLVSYLAHFFDPNVLLIEGENGEGAENDCLEAVSGPFQRVVDRIYVDAVRANIDPKRGLIDEIMSDLKVASELMFNESTWLSDVAKARLRQKLAKMRHAVAWPHWLTNDTLLDELYARHEVNREGSYFTNFLNVSRFDYSSLFLDPSYRPFVDYPMPYTIVNAVYFSEQNAFFVPVAVLEDMMLPGPNTPIGFVYGQFANWPSHEMFHAFDSNGIKYDENGNITTIDAILGNSTDAFNSSINCVVNAYAKKKYNVKYKIKLEEAESQDEQIRRVRREEAGADDEDNGTTIKHSKYTWKPVYLNGSSTVDENLADLNGMRAAWIAYKMAFERNATAGAQRLPGLTEYNMDQVFFISSAFYWCHKNQSEQIRMLKIDPHAPSDARVNIVLQNFDEFSKAFACKPKDKMNNGGEKQCRMY